MSSATLCVAANGAFTTRIPRAPAVPTISPKEEEEILLEARNLARRLQRIKTSARDAQSAARLMTQVRAALSEDRRFGTPEEEIEALWAEVDRLTQQKKRAIAEAPPPVTPAPPPARKAATPLETVPTPTLPPMVPPAPEEPDRPSPPFSFYTPYVPPDLGDGTDHDDGPPGQGNRRRAKERP